MGYGRRRGDGYRAHPKWQAAYWCRGCLAKERQLAAREYRIAGASAAAAVRAHAAESVAQAAEPAKAKMGPARGPPRIARRPRRVRRNTRRRARKASGSKALAKVTGGDSGPLWREIATRTRGCPGVL